MTALATRRSLCTLAAAVAFLAATSAYAATAQPQAAAASATTLTTPSEFDALPPYLPKAPIEGELKLAGSSAMNHLATLWADGLRQIHGKAKLSVVMYDSAQVLPRLAKDEMQIGLMSRPLTAEELKSGGVMAIATAKDVLGIVVHPDNPLKSLTAAQGIQLLRDPADPSQPGARTWGQLGVTSALAETPITLYGRSAGAGAWGYLVNRFLGEGAKSRATSNCAGYAEICTKVAADRGGVGYVSLSLAPPATGKVLPLTLTTGETIPAPGPGEIVDPRYPLVRELYVVVKFKPGQQLSPIAEEFLRYVLSRSGQQDAVKAGFLPMRRDEVLASRDQLGWTGKR
jgi:phosphate transport system substrate-binding protein